MSASKNSRAHFLLKASSILAIVLAIGAWFDARFYFGIDGQEYKCLPFTLFIVDTAQKDIERGQYFAYVADGMAPAVRDGDIALKIAAGVSGDIVDIQTEETFVNGVSQPNGPLHFLNKLDHLTEEKLVREVTLHEGELFGMGTEPTSFDSRYWGAVKQGQVEGRAYAIF